MELDITSFVAETDPFQFSASVAELGPDAGRITWDNAKDEGERAPLLNTAEEIEAGRHYIRDFGAWDDVEVVAWSPREVNALLIQFIAGELREIEALCSKADGSIDWETVETLAGQGTIAGNIWPGENGRILFNMSA